MSLTGAPPPVPAALAAATTGTDPVTGTPTVIGILDARGPDRLTTSVSDVLHAASGPGNIITGKVVEIRPDGTVFLTTPSGAELSFRHPPEVPIELGSTITLRLVAIVPAPQAVLLAVDGRSVAGLLARAGNTTRQAPADSPPAATIQAGPPATTTIPARPASPADLGIGIATELVATLGRETDSSRAAIPGSTGAAISARGLLTAAAETIDPATVSAPIIAVLVRTAPPRPGVSAPVLGTRYLLSVAAVAPPSGAPAVAATSAPTPVASPAVPVATATDPALPPTGTATIAPRDSVVTTAAPSGPPTAAAAVSSPTASPASPPTEPPDLTAFTPQAGLLAGRVVAPRRGDEILVETAVGTLALPQGEDQVPVGSAVHLRIVAVARPALPVAAAATTDSAVAAAASAITDDAAPAVPQTALQQALAILATLQPNLAKATTEAFVLQPGAQLAALIFGFLAGVHGGAPKRWTDSPARAALDALDHGDVREKLDGDAEAIGSQTLPADPSDWKVTVLPYLGAESLQPARLYQRMAEARIEGDGSAASATGQRFVIEIELRRLGPLQFDGLVRERRFDLAVRTTHALDALLQAEIGHIFRETIGISGYAGEVVFGRLGRFPLLQTASQAGVHEISA